MAREELAAWLRLLLTPGVGNETARKLLAAFGLPHAVFEQSTTALCAVVGNRLGQALQATPLELDAAVDTLQQWLQAAGNRHVLTLGDANYPPLLLQMADPPLMLHVIGQLQALHHPNKIAIVGSRNPTPQGQINAQQFAAALGDAGLCVVSGLALGVDGAAHEGALQSGAPTIAVVGTGLDRVYPKRHFDLAHRIAVHGAIVSEYPLGTAPLPAHFPQRNRIIAGLSQGTLVVEAAVASGSLITARLASEMGREVFAIPGSIHAPQARGCHALIRQGAKLVESAQDVLEDLQLAPEDAALPPTPSETTADPDGLLKAMGYDPVSLDALQARTGLDTATLQAKLFELEMQGDVGRLPGGLLLRTAQG
jgi:DNA processing protein